ncbi:hypothetical protein V8E55_001465 [Tylopilus felleus]|jgi:hypothetical protein
MPLFPLDKPYRFSLDFAGVTSLLGGDNAVSAMTAVHVYGNRRWLGWYNTPGSFQIARRLNSFAKSPSTNPTPSSVHIDPTSLLELDGSKGPKFRAAHSGTIMEETGYLATLFMKECAAWGSDGKVVPGRVTQSVGITIADLGQAPDSEMRPAHSSPFILLSASFPIIVSVGACAVCAVFEDWYASSLILFGILASGLSGLVLGSADFVFTHPPPATGSPAGDGILSSSNSIVLLRGTEGAVNSITRGRFSLRFSNVIHYTLVWWCSVFFFVQCITQLFLIPQASLFGQVVFLASLGMSALHNAWLSSLDKEKIHRQMLFGQVLQGTMLTKYTLGTYTTAVVFMLLVLQIGEPNDLLNALLPNDTQVWRQWKMTILEWLRNPNRPVLQLDRTSTSLAQTQKDLLGLLYEDAQSAYNGYEDYLRSRTTVVSDV